LLTSVSSFSGSRQRVKSIQIMILRCQEQHCKVQYCTETFLVEVTVRLGVKNAFGLQVPSLPSIINAILMIHPISEKELRHLEN